MSGPHASHKLRFSMDADSYDFVCEYCGATDEVVDWADLRDPCPKAPTEEGPHVLDPYDKMFDDAVGGDFLSDSDSGSDDDDDDDDKTNG